jgi:citrate lyase subunit beta/citryl-CoA lyase
MTVSAPLRETPIWRSVLFVPAVASTLIERAQTRGADAVQIDLEDAIPADRKEEARRAAPGAITHLASGPGDVLVRINRPWRDAVRDLECCVQPGVAAITLPKTGGPADLDVLGEMLDEFEPARGIAPGTIGIVAQIETAAGLLAMMRAERFPARLAAVTLGPEDFTLDLGVEPCRENLIEPLRSCVLVARAAGIVPLGFARTIGDYADLDALQRSVAEANSMGLRGSFCIHPKQVPVLNEGFMPSADALLRARRIVQSFEEGRAAGLGVVSDEGQMIDKPIYDRAVNLLARQSRRTS